MAMIRERNAEAVQARQEVAQAMAAQVAGAQTTMAMLERLSTQLTEVASATARDTTRKGHTTADRSKGSGQTSPHTWRKCGALCVEPENRERGRRITQHGGGTEPLGRGHAEGRSKHARRRYRGRHRCTSLRSVGGLHRRHGPGKASRSCGLHREI